MTGWFTGSRLGWRWHKCIDLRKPRLIRECIADVGLGLRHASGMVLRGVGHHEIEGDGEHQRSRGSSRMSVKR